MTANCRTTALIAAGFLVSTLWFAGGASAATTLGQTPPSGGIAAGCPSDIEVVQSSVGLGNAYDVPGPGVITRWMTYGHPTVMVEGGGMFTDNGDSAALRVYRRVGASNTVNPIAESATQTLSGGGLLAFSTRIPVSGGELIGIRVAGGGGDNVSVCRQSVGPSLNQVLSASPAGPLNQERAMSLGNQFLVDVGAVLEPDVDRDGFGDETQDGCPTDATAQGACPDRLAPDTTIDRAPPKVIKTKRKQKKISISFTSSESATFACSLDGASSRPCSSPFKAKVTTGHHTFEVVATDAAGNADATPAKVKFRVKRKR